MNNSAAKIKAVSLDELLGVSTAVPGKAGNEVVELPLSQLYPFRNHPFEVRDDEKMAELADSIRNSGVLVPGIVRPGEQGGYEIVAGHSRCRAAGLAGLSTMPAIIKDLTDAEATVIMVDSNIQREDLSYKEKAFAYKMKYEALKELGLSDSDGDKRLDQALAEQLGESRNKIQRYIRLTYLVPELLALVDARKLGFIAATDISYLTAAEQELLLQFINDGVVPTGAQALKLKEYSKDGKLNETVMELILKQEKTANQLVIKTKQLRDYFPEDYEVSQMADVIFMLLKQWKKERH